MGLSAWNAYRARQAELEKTLTSHNTENTSTSPVNDGVEVEEKQLVEEVKPKKKRTK